jgi:hypothetical protein
LNSHHGKVKVTAAKALSPEGDTRDEFVDTLLPTVLFANPEEGPGTVIPQSWPGFGLSRDRRRGGEEEVLARGPRSGPHGRCALTVFYACLRREEQRVREH